MKQGHKSQQPNRSGQSNKNKYGQPSKHQLKPMSEQGNKVPVDVKSNEIVLNKRIVSPQKLKILVLSGNQLQSSQLQFLAKCINLVKLDLSHNHITRLHERFGLYKIQNLRVLNLDSNKLHSIEAIQVIFSVKSLEILSYRDNRLQQNPKSEHLIVNFIHNLKVINQRLIFVQQRDPSTVVDRKNQFIATDFEDWQPAQHSEKYYLKVLKLQLEYADNMWMFHNPIVKIQRIWRAILEQTQQIPKQNTSNAQNKTSQINHQIKESKQAIQRGSSVLGQIFKKWKQYSSSLRQIRQQMKQNQYQTQNLEFTNQTGALVRLQNKQYLTFDIEGYYLMKRNLKIRSDFQKYLRKIREKVYVRRMAQIFCRNIKLKRLSFADPTSSYYDISGIKQTKRIYFSRTQQHLIQNFLAHISKDFNKKSEIERSEFRVSSSYVSIRLLDPDTYSIKPIYSALTYLLWPCMRSVVLKKKRFPYKLKSSIIKIKALTYIKNRDTRLSQQQIKKSNKTYKRVDRFFQHQYYDGLSYFHCQDEFVLRQLIRMLYYHNTKALKFQKIIQRSEMMSLLESYTQNVAVYTQKLLERTTSAVKIQQQWRRYINNKRQKQSIYEKLKKNRASRLIQRFLRDRVFYHRLSFQKQISLDLANFTQNDLIIHQNLYKLLPEVISESQKHIQLYKRLRLQMRDRIQLYHQDFNQKQVFFPTLRKLHFESQSFSSKDGRPASSIDIYRFFHQNSHVRIIECKGQTFYQFTYSSIQKAKLRAACFALLTYRMFGCSYLLLLSKSTLYMYNQRINQYRKYGIRCSPFLIKSYQQSHNHFTVNLISDISLQNKTPFVFIDQKYLSFFPMESESNVLYTKKIQVEFYQKRFQDYPQKFQNVLTIAMSNGEQISKQKQIEEKFLNLKKLLIKQTDLDSSLEVNNGSRIENKSYRKGQCFKETKIKLSSTKVHIVGDIGESLYEKSQRQGQQFSRIGDNNTSRLVSKNFNSKIDTSIKKTSQKRFSLYELEALSQIQRIQQDQGKTQNFNRITQEYESTKKEKVTKYLQSERQKRDYFKQKKQIDLSTIRQKRRQQKMMNMTLKSFNQSERTQILRKKAQKIKQYRKRSLSTNNKFDESDFMQQGNFIMQQQLKMNLMRNKIKQVEKLRQKRKSNSQTKNLGNASCNRQLSQQSKSINSNQSRLKKKILFEGKQTQMLDMEMNNVPSASFETHNNEGYGGQTQIINKKSYVKKRSSKAGAYIRDPSYVHGVFPQQYYPIQSTKGSIMFPRVN